MKKIFLIIVSVALLISLSSCKDMLNIAPANQIATENMWTSESLADAGMNGLYRNFYTNSTDWETRMLSNSSYSGINKMGWMGMEFQSQYTEPHLSVLNDASKSAYGTVIYIEWRWCYTGIHRINDAIYNLERAPLSTEKYERYLCEAKFLRAWYYSRLNKIFQGVPLYLEPISSDDCTRTQSTSTEVWEAVIADLTDCINCANFPDNTLTNNYGRPSKGAAYSLRGMAYMWLAWENGEDSSYYQLAANDFAMVSQCGYGLWNGKYIDFFNYDNETSWEMIFPIQYTEEEGYCDDIQDLVGARDFYFGLCWIRPSTDFVDYYQNADGSKFNYEDIIPEWNDEVFVNDPAKREVFFLRDSVSLDENNDVVRDFWDESQAGSLKERINTFGLDVFNKYYLKDGNEDRVRALYNDRDPRLKQTILVPYDKYTAYYFNRNDGETQYDKEIRWPYIKDHYISGSDFRIHENYPNTCVYKKYMASEKGQMKADWPLYCQTDWPLIRYTDVYLYLAECYVHLGRLADAVSIVNEIRSRAEMPSISVGSADDVMEAVRYERRVELCMEGVDYFDEVRWGTVKDMKFQGNDRYGFQSFWGQWDGIAQIWYYTDTMYPWPAPASECERNPNLTRREGWVY